MTAQLSCFRCGKTFSASFQRKDRRAYCSAECKRETYRQEKKKPGQERLCRYCLKPFLTSHGGPIKYCSAECLRKARRATDKGLACEGVIPVGRVFVRSDDRTPVKVLIDLTGLPYAEPIYLWQP